MKKLGIALFIVSLSTIMHGAQKPLEPSVNLMNILSKTPYDYKAIKIAATKEGVDPNEKSLPT